MKKKGWLYRLNDVSFSYKSEKIQTAALSQITVDIPMNALTVIAGPSGSGKSTLLNLLGLIEPVMTGSMMLESEPVHLMKESRKCSLRRLDIGFIFQNFHLIPVLTAEENVEYFLKRNGLTKTEIKEKTETSLRSVGLWDHRKKKPGELSGGQQQRVAIARALAKSPRVIIADEPTANLDQNTGREIMQILTALVKKQGISVILTSHDPMVQSFATCRIDICDGKLIHRSES